MCAKVKGTNLERFWRDLFFRQATVEEREKGKGRVKVILAGGNDPKMGLCKFVLRSACRESRVEAGTDSSSFASTM